MSISWLREHMRWCQLYGCLERQGQSLMDDSCVNEECSPILWLRNVNEFADTKDSPFHVMFLGSSMKGSYNRGFDYTKCDSHLIQVHGALVSHQHLFYCVILFLFISQLERTPLSSRLIRILTHWDRCCFTCLST